MKKKKDNNSVKIYNISLMFAFLVFVVLIMRLFFLSTSKEVDGINLQAFAKTRTTKESKQHLIELLAFRTKQRRN